LASLGFMAFLCWGQQRSPTSQEPPKELPEVANLNVDVTTTFGGPVGKVLVILKLGSVEKYRKLGDVIRFESIPFGLYDIEIQAANFAKRRERVGIYQPEARLWFGLYLSPVEETRAEIRGMISPMGRDDLWVRVVPLYASDFVEDRVNSSGEFRLSGLHPGRYVLLVLSKEKLIKTQTVDFSGGALVLYVDLTGVAP
jgi:hypothetical protein